ncbi:MAG: 4-phosphopantoate--beta-alanine ligase [Candidatus Methanomethylophilaceae archaeon]|jgi:4-phosphopantoate--beta-alanine ligase
MAVPKNHPRYESLMTRERLQEMVARGIVSPTGMISHGRGEAFDYLMGEKSTAAALEAEKAAAAFLLNAERPVVCVNGNAAALGAKQLIKTAEAVGAKIEVNIFHRSEERMESIIEYMESEGAGNVLGRNPDARIPGLTSDRALCTEEGIFNSDVILVPIEDGDRAEALVNMGKTVISIDLNPLSRTSKKASVSISDEMNRALANIIKSAEELKKDGSRIAEIINGYDNGSVRRRTVAEICGFLKKSIEEE